jgi:hypothetical protein
MYIKIIILIIFLSGVFLSPSSALEYHIKESTDTEASVEIQNSANFNAAAATLGIRQRPNGRFNLKVRVPKIKNKVVRVRVSIPEEFTPHIKVKNKVFRGKRGKNNIVFFLRVKKSINKLIPVGSLIDVPVTLTDLQNGAEEEFILEVRD